MKSAGQIAFEAYKADTLGKTHDGREIPHWNDVGERVRGAWDTAAKAVVDYAVEGRAG